MFNVVVVRKTRSNAVEFTDTGSVTLEIARDDAGSVRIAVSDTGPGIRQEEIGRLTEAFYQSGSNSNKARAGTGLGLAIVHGLVEAHNGRLMIDSKLGKDRSLPWPSLP